jgi:hypothetical protein
VESFLRAISPPLSQARRRNVPRTAERMRGSAHSPAHTSAHLHVCSPLFLPLPLQIDDVIAAVPASGITMAHLRNAADISAGLRSLYMSTATSALRITLPADCLAFILALDKLLARSGGGTGDAAEDK